MKRHSRCVGHLSPGRASFIAVVSGAVFSVLLVLVVVKFVGERAGTKGDGKSSPAQSVSAAGQAAEERSIEASRQKYRRELRFCEALRQFEGADLHCLGDFAAEHKDLFFCGEIPAASREDCVRRVAVAAGQGRLCDQVSQPDMKRDCYLDAAAVSGDEAPCEKILDKQLQKACLAIAKSDTAGCEAVTETASRTACFHRLAVRTRNPGLCESVRDRQMPESFQHQLFDCWKDAAAATGRPEDCDRIPHEGVHVNTSGWHAYNRCREKVELSRAGANCREGPADLTCRGKTAAAKNEFKLCQNLRSYTDMDLCALTFGFRKNDSSVCASIQEERLRTTCVEITGRTSTP
jgi:hypothetical protein